MESELVVAEPVLPESEVRNIVRLLGRVAGLKGTMQLKRRELMTGLAVLVEADAWSWITARAEKWNDNPAVASFLHGGTDERQLSASMQALQDRRNTPVEYKALNELRLTHKSFTRTWDQLVTAEQWNSPQNREFLDRAGYDHILYCVKVLDEDGLFSGIALKRGKGRPNFTPLQRRVAHVVSSEVDWLHQPESLDAVTLKVRPLSPRRRVVLGHLIEGHSLPDIAERLECSYHTVKDHVKAIYGHFGVHSKEELFRNFMRGDGADLEAKPAQR